MVVWEDGGSDPASYLIGASMLGQPTSAGQRLRRFSVPSFRTR
jgi:hypothetical protein